MNLAVAAGAGMKFSSQLLRLAANWSATHRRMRRLMRAFRDLSFSRKLSVLLAATAPRRLRSFSRPRRIMP